MSRSARSPIIPGSSAASSIPNSRASPLSRIPFSRRVSERRRSSGSAAWPPRPNWPWSPSSAVPIEFADFSKRLVLIAGPCVIESEEHVHLMAHGIRAAVGDFVFKASYDKANRTSGESYRGPGTREGLRILAGLKSEGFPILTDIHEPSQAEPAAEVAEILQIPAFLCRQTDLLIAAGRTGRIVNIKKGQFVAPHDMPRAAEKVASTGNSKVVLTERGSSFGYNNLVVDMRDLKIMHDAGWPVVFDATHSVQLPGASGAASGGQPEFIAPLARAAVAVGVSGIFVETHDTPEKALSDGPNALRLDLLAGFWKRLQAIDAVARVWRFSSPRG